MSDFNKVQAYIKSKGYKPETSMVNLTVKLLLMWEAWEEDTGEPIALEEYLKEIVGNNFWDYDYE